MKLMENILVALRSLKANLVRAILTLSMISFGIMSLVGVMTAIDQVIYSLNDNFASLGANSFSFRPAGGGIRGRDKSVKMGDPIKFKQAIQFKEKYTGEGKVSVFVSGGGSKVAKYKEEKTDPVFNIFGVDENYFLNRGMDLEMGRAFSRQEVSSGNNIAVVGQDIIKDLYDNKVEEALGKTVSMDNRRYTIIGVLKKKGRGSGDDQDKTIFIPLYTAKRYYGSPRRNYNLEVAVRKSEYMEGAIAAATGVFRPVRGLKAGQENDFEIRKSDGLLQQIKDSTSDLRAGAVGIGFMTLLGAAIGLMNIMLVSVTERTREIGVRKALGAKKSHILIQFLTEAIVICQIGSLVGVFLALMTGFGISRLLGGAFVMPWLWIGIAFLTSFITGLAAGIIPARKASNMDPIESLRYE